jgi:hypothetical protein
MRCWACPHPIKFTDEVCQLPIVNALVHRKCYERELKQPAPVRMTLSHFLAQGTSRAA